MKCKIWLRVTKKKKKENQKRKQPPTVERLIKYNILGIEVDLAENQKTRIGHTLTVWQTVLVNILGREKVRYAVNGIYEFVIWRVFRYAV